MRGEYRRNIFFNCLANFKVNVFINRSMTDLDQNPSAHSPRRKFSFRFPNLSHSTSHDKDGSSLTGGGGNNTLNHHLGMNYNSKDRRNFSEEAKNVPDLQVSIFVPISRPFLLLVQLMIASHSKMTVKLTS